MRILMTILCLVFFFSCGIENNNNKKPSFLIGNWKRLNDKVGSQTFETWNTNLTGFGYTKKNGKTTFSEKLSIETIKDTLYLKVTGVNKNPTFFKFTNQTDTSFVCENPQNDFPKKIKYYLEDKLLKATISSDDFRVDFIFTRSNIDAK